VFVVVQVGFIAVMLGMQFAGFGRVVLGVEPMTMRHMGVMAGCHVVFVFMEFGGLAVMVGGRLEMLGGLEMMFGDLGFWHGGTSN
jgi:hypothetical protein